MQARNVRVVGIIGVLWNLIGVGMYLAHVGLFGPEAAATPEGAPPMPLAITVAFALAVWGGLAGSVGLALLKRWAAPVLWVALIAAVVDWAWVLGVGNGQLGLGIAVVAIALALALVGQKAQQTSALTA